MEIKLVVSRLPNQPPLCVTPEFLLSIEMEFPPVTDEFGGTTVENGKRKAHGLGEAIGVLAGDVTQHSITLREPHTITGKDEVEIEGRLWQTDAETRLPSRRPELYEASLVLQHIDSWNLLDKEGKEVPLTLDGLLNLESPIPGTIIALVLPHTNGGAVDFSRYFPKSG